MTARTIPGTGWKCSSATTTPTTASVHAFIAGRAGYRLIGITANWGQARGKANVLAQLARHATGDVLLTTDADPTAALQLFLIPTVAVWLFLGAALWRRAQPRLWHYAWAYPFYWYWSFWAMTVYYFLPVKVRWKGR